MNVLDGAETLRVIDHLHVWGTIAPLESEKRGNTQRASLSERREEGRQSEELLIRDSWPSHFHVSPSVCVSAMHSEHQQ